MNSHLMVPTSVNHVPHHVQSVPVSLPVYLVQWDSPSAMELVSPNAQMVSIALREYVTYVSLVVVSVQLPTVKCVPMVTSSMMEVFVFQVVLMATT